MMTWKSFPNITKTMTFFICWIRFQFQEFQSAVIGKKIWSSLQTVPCVHLSIRIISIIDIDILWSFTKNSNTKYDLMLQYDHYIFDKFYLYTIFSVMTFIPMVSFCGIGFFVIFKIKVRGKCNPTFKKIRKLNTQQTYQTTDASGPENMKRSPPLRPQSSLQFSGLASDFYCKIPQPLQGVCCGDGAHCCQRELNVMKKRDVVSYKPPLWMRLFLFEFPGWLYRLPMFHRCSLVEQCTHMVT